MEDFFIIKLLKFILKRVYLIIIELFASNRRRITKENEGTLSGKDGCPYKFSW